MPPGAWALIQACWQQQPAQRPTMADVVAQLQQLMDREQAGPSSRRSSFSFPAAAGSRHSSASAGAEGAIAKDASTAVAAGAPCNAAAAAEPPQQGCACVIC
jgi:hypothetical protein